MIGTKKIGGKYESYCYWWRNERIDGIGQCGDAWRGSRVAREKSNPWKEVITHGWNAL